MDSIKKTPGADRLYSTLKNIRYELACITVDLVRKGAPAELIQALDINYMAACTALGETRWATSAEKEEAASRGHDLWYVLVPSGRQVCTRECQNHAPVPTAPQQTEASA